MHGTTHVPSQCSTTCPVMCVCLLPWSKLKVQARQGAWVSMQARSTLCLCSERRSHADPLVNPQAMRKCLGVEWDSATGQWTAHIWSGTSEVHLGYYPTEDEAGLASDTAAYLVHGR